ncbi:MAG: glycoside hydrolase family 5 protein [Clostridia bacterium]|nr:glycoside hydrolase family 5 protein [Clostridia bacterium]
MKDPMLGKWSEERAWKWYNAQPWIRGFNGYPSNCVNRIAMWQAYNHKEVFEEIAYEFDLAQKTGFNAVRAIIQFECWYYEHESFMQNLEEYFTLADQYGLKVMLTLGNDCTIPKARWKPVSFGEQKVDWGYHSGIRTGPHTGDYTSPGYCLLDEPEIEGKYYEMVDELAARYAKDDRLQIWDIWNEPGNSNRGTMSLKAMETFFSIVRSYDPIQPLTADVYAYRDNLPRPESVIEARALELSDVITYHGYMPYPDLVLTTENLKNLYHRPLINNEWLNRLNDNNIHDIFPYFYAERIGSYHWGLIAGFSQTYEPWGAYYIEYQKEGSTLDLTKWQHDLYRFNGLPYDNNEVRLIKRFSALADKRDGIQRIPLDGEQKRE